MATSPITENKRKDSVSPIGQKIQNTVYFKSKAYFNVLSKNNALFLKSKTDKVACALSVL
jgi:hypothetical protein